MSTPTRHCLSASSPTTARKPNPFCSPPHTRVPVYSLDAPHHTKAKLFHFVIPLSFLHVSSQSL
jgi:hypothetical protein